MSEPGATGRDKTRIIVALAILCVVFASLAGIFGYLSLSKGRKVSEDKEQADGSAPGEGKARAREGRHRRGLGQRGVLGRQAFRALQQPAAPPELVMARLQERERWFNTLPPDPNRAPTEAAQQKAVDQFLRRLGFVVTSIECRTGACRIWLGPDPNAEKPRSPPTRPTDRLVRDKWHVFHYVQGSQVRSLVYAATTGTLPDISAIQPAPLGPTSAPVTGAVATPPPATTAATPAATAKAR